MAYKFVFPPSLLGVHPIFYAFRLQKYVPNESHVLSLNLVVLGPNMLVEEEPITILYRKIRKFRTKETASVNITALPLLIVVLSHFLSVCEVGLEI